MTHIILCGGNGTRLWPLSRTLMPKQFISLFEEGSLFQMTVRRNLPFCDRRVIVSNAEQYFLALDQLEEMGLEPSEFLLEPLARNTAPAIALAAFSLDPKERMFVTPSDHLIEEGPAYESAIEEAKKLADSGLLVTIGIEPSAPETGFGYIEARGNEVQAFHEKPDRMTAESYLRKGGYFWNSGMFCFQAGVFLEELRRYAPEIYECSEAAYRKMKRDGAVGRIPYEVMEAIPEESVDYAVMERSDRIAMVPGSFRWSDLGSFDALAEEFPTDEAGNTLGENLIVIDSRNNFVHSRERMVALVDVDDLVVVDTADALLVTRRGSSQKIKDIVKRLKGRESDLPHIHVTAHRPWGTYTVLESADRYKIKRIVVKPGKRLSLQKHFHRSEHWIVVSGTALVQVGEEEKIVRSNESVYIPIGELHRLENPGKIPLVLVEAQVGEYTGEDDIVRTDDDFDRAHR